MKLKTTLLASAVFLTISGQALAGDCAAPTAPVIPDGKSANKDELIAAQQSIKTYQGQLGSYRNCLKKETGIIDKKAEGAAEKEAALLAAYNASVDSEEAVAAQFNEAVRAFKAK